MGDWMQNIPRTRSEEERDFQRVLAMSMGGVFEEPSIPSPAAIPSKADKILNGNNTTSTVSTSPIASASTSTVAVEATVDGVTSGDSMENKKETKKENTVRV